MLTFQRPTLINSFLAQEYIALGQRVKRFTLEAWVGGKWVSLRDERAPEGTTGLTTIGYKRIVCFPTIKTTRLRFTINDAKACPLISNIGVYCAPPLPKDAVKIPASALQKASTAHEQMPFLNIAIANDSSNAVLIDLQEPVACRQLVYIPLENDQDGLATHYELYASDDMLEWKRWLGGEFSNIENNPIPQTLTLPGLQTRYLKLVATRLSKGKQLRWKQIVVR